MATTTTNNGWTIPQSTDLVTNGATAIATLGNGIDTSVGKGLLAWQSYTPTLTNITKGTGATEAYHYCQVGKTVTVRIRLTLGTGGALTGLPTWSLPVTASANSVGLPNGLNQMYDASATTLYFGFMQLNATTSAVMYVYNAASTYLAYNSVSGTIPTTWTVSDYFYGQFTYEAA